MSTSPIAIIFGAGARVGAAATETFLKANHRVARVSRSQDPANDTNTLLNISGDLSVPSTVEDVFAAVRQKWGDPSVVVYNAYGHAPTAKDPVSTFNSPTADFAKAQNTNFISAFAAIRESIASFTAPSTPAGPKTFIFTGNIMNQGTLPNFAALGSGKAATAWMVECADGTFRQESGGGEGVRFFYVDERHEDGTPLFTGLGGQGHADAFLGLAERREAWKGLAWLVTFVSGDEGKETRFKEFRKGLILPEGM